ncbi:MAG: response regulator [Candidatus Ratteibacteria bacterium]|nr:response regulator [Candidatus Ratteibacteria bacterium]
MAGKILVVDDELDVRRVLEFRLKNAGYDVIGASDGESCLSKAKEEAPGLIILDVMMPGINGFEVCKLLKESDKTKDIPVIMLTVLAGEADLSKGLEKGASCFISKPFNIIDLLWEVKTIIAGEKKGKRDTKSKRKISPGRKKSKHGGKNEKAKKGAGS